MRARKDSDAPKTYILLSGLERLAGVGFGKKLSTGGGDNCKGAPKWVGSLPGILILKT